MTRQRNIVALGAGDGTEHEPVEAHGAEVEETTSAQASETLDHDWADDEADSPAPDRSWLLPLLALTVIAGWSGFFFYAYRAELLAGGTPQQWSGWISAWSVPVLLVVAVWLLAMRHSRREAARFGDAARSLSHESAMLEARMTVVNRELSLARDFIAAQSRDLESLGRVATDRLSKHSDKLAGLIHDNGERIDSIASVSTTALDNMKRLRDELPVVSNSARDVANQVGNAGHTAQAQLAELVAGFERLNEFGQASEAQVQHLKTIVDAALTDFQARNEQLDRLTNARFAELGEKSEAFRAELDGREVEALAGIRRRADALAEELAHGRSEIEQAEAAALEALREKIALVARDGAAMASELRQGEDSAATVWQQSIAQLEENMHAALARIAEIDAGAMENSRKRLTALHAEAERLDQGAEARNQTFETWLEQRKQDNDARMAEETASLERRLAELDARISERQQEHLAHISGLDERGNALAERLAQLGAQIQSVAAHGEDVGTQLTASLERLAHVLANGREVLAGTDKEVAELTDASVRLLEIIQAGARHSKDDLPTAIGVADSYLTQIEGRTEALGMLMADASEKGQALSAYVLSAKENTSGALSEIEQLQANITAHGNSQREQADQMQASLLTIAETSEELTRRTQGELREAIDGLQGAVRGVVEELETNSTAAVQRMAERIGVESGDAIDKALRLQTAESIGQLEQAAAHASGVSREAARQLRDQLAKVAELTDNLETRVTQARQRAEEQIDNDFSRRMALIVESLNSNAIDIAKALSNDVSDTAWASYLRGDRGIFTRRAVRLLDNSAAKDIAETYLAEHDFREHVSRYIHDFEAMLRSMLSTRDGNALAVTLLSSDMGKLYVALAQSIERLRA